MFNQRQLEEYLRNRPYHEPDRIEDVELRVEELPAGSRLPLISMRNRLFMGVEGPASVEFPDGYRLSTLAYNGGVWMQDSPQEIWQMRRAIEEAHGNVLVGGLGLGIVSHLIAELNAEASSVVTVEQDQRVIDLVDRRGQLMHNACVCQDLFEYLRDLKPGQIDFAFLDIWQPTGQTVWYQEVVPLRRLCRGKIDRDSVLCWNEEEMIGQYRSPIRWGLLWYALLPEDLFGLHDTTNVVFHRAARRQGLVKEDSESCDPIRLEELAGEVKGLPELQDRLLYGVGTDEWEKEFGDLWDKACEERQVIYENC